MEKKFYTDDFEQFLKETADDFRMYPSKRVWNSLYNNLHPGRKWPSLSVCLLLVSSIIFIGLSHKNEIAGSGNLAKKENPTSSLLAYQKQDNNKNPTVVIPAIASTNTNLQSQPGISSASSNLTLITTSGNNNRRQVPVAINHPVRTNRTSVNANNITNAAVDQNENNNSVVNNQVSNSVKSSVAVELTSPIAEGMNDESGLERSNLAILQTEEKVGEIKPILRQPLLPIVKNSKPAQDQEWIEDYAFHNQPTSSLKSKLAYELYITPSVGYRSLVKNLSYDLPARNSLTGSSASSQPNSLIHGKAFNLAAGYSLIYSYSKSTHIKAGIQLNYTNYTIRAHELGHSTLTTLLLNDPSGGIELNQKPTTLANLPGSGSDKKLNSSTFQVSLPFGTDVKIAGKHNFQWFVGGTVQPTYVLFGNAYLISSDMKNYIYDSKFLRKWNINTGIETFVSYRTKKGVTFNAGPEVRYQLFSTYDKKYSYDEKLYSIGVKFGMIKNF